jgi:hypothetical protein
MAGDDILVYFLHELIMILDQVAAALFLEAPRHHIFDLNLLLLLRVNHVFIRICMSVVESRGWRLGVGGRLDLAAPIFEVFVHHHNLGESHGCGFEALGILVSELISLVSSVVFEHVAFFIIAAHAHLRGYVV